MVFVAVSVNSNIPKESLVWGAQMLGGALEQVCHLLQGVGPGTLNTGAEHINTCTFHLSGWAIED